MFELLAKILCEGRSLQGSREALDGLLKVRHTALSYEAWLAYRSTCELTAESIYSGAKSWGLPEGHITGR